MLTTFMGARGGVPGVPTAPSFSAAPAWVGGDSAEVGVALVFTGGAFSGSPYPTVTYQLVRDGVVIAGAITSPYTPVAADEGTVIAVRATATNGVGSDAVSTGVGSSAVLASGAPPAVDALDVFVLGHSGFGHDIPNSWSRIVDEDADPAVALNLDYGVGNGATLEFHRLNPTSGEGENATTALSAQPYDVLGLLEAVPIVDNIDGASTVSNVLHFANQAYAENSDVQVYLVEMWEDRVLTTGGLRLAVNTRRTYYEQIRADVNTSFAGNDIMLVPCASALAALMDAVEAGDVSDVTVVGDLFTDDIHPSLIASYFLSCVWYATVHQRSPVGLPIPTLDRFDTALATVPTAAMAADMQELAWTVVQAEPYSGVDAVAGIPTIASMSPAGMSVGHGIDDDIVVTFSEDMNAATIYGETLRFSDSDGTLVPASISVVGAVATISPTSSLSSATEYTVTATPAIQDSTDAVFMATDRSLSFTTETVSIPPEFNTSSPVAGATGAARFAGIAVYFFQDIDAATVDDTTFLVTLTSDGSDVPGTLSVSGGGISFSPDTPLAASAEHRVQLTSGVSGVAPRGAIVPIDYTFTTSA